MPGCWHSREIELAFGMEEGAPSGSPTVYNWHGRAQLHEGEIETFRAEREAELRQRAEEFARSEVEVDRLRRLVRERGYDEDS